LIVPARLEVNKAEINKPGAPVNKFVQRQNDAWLILSVGFIR
jgi:hypothetical protein